MHLVKKVPYPPVFIQFFAMVFAIHAGTALAAPDVSLQVTHSSVAMGADGIKRSTEFSERVLRRGNTVWIERVMPAHADHDLHHALASAQAIKVTAKAHAHPDLGAATRWIEQTADGKIRLRLVSVHDKTIVNIAPAEYGTVGFDGSWPAAYHLIDPVVLKKLQPGSKTAQGQWYASPAAPGTGQVRVLWDAQRAVPLQVLTRSADGLSSRSTTVRLLPDTDKAPWRATTAFAEKDYSDFLD
jgi:hypothetical protein